MDIACDLSLRDMHIVDSMINEFLMEDVIICQFDNIVSKKNTFTKENVMYLYDGEDVVGEIGSDGTIQKETVHGPGIDEPLWMVTKKGRQYYLNDILGSVTALTDSEGELTDEYTYRAFGEFEKETVKSSGRTRVAEVSNDYGFTGRTFNEFTGLMNYRSRFYSPSLGIFTQYDRYPEAMVKGMGGGTGSVMPSLPLAGCPSCGLNGGMGMTAGTNYGMLYDPSIFGHFQYVNYSPLNGIDPFGELTIVIHGIWSKRDWMAKYAAKIKDNHNQSYTWTYPKSLTDIIVYPKTALNTDLSEAKMFAEFIRRVHRDYPNEPINIVAHSAGGEIAINAARLIRTTLRINKLITLGSPIKNCITNIDETWSFTSPSDPISEFPPASKPYVHSWEWLGISHTEWTENENVLNAINSIINNDTDAEKYKILNNHEYYKKQPVYYQNTKFTREEFDKYIQAKMKNMNYGRPQY